jgi:hypothetical protein
MMSSPIEYLFSGAGSGSLGTRTFSHANFLITVTTDTGQITRNDAKKDSAFPQGSLTVSGANTWDTITIVGLGKTFFRFTVTIAVFPVAAAHGFKVSLGLVPDELLSVASPLFQDYDLRRRIRPISGAVTFSKQAFPTASGDLIFSSVTSVSFQAVVPSAKKLVQRNR